MTGVEDVGDIAAWFDGGQRLFVELEDGFIASVFARRDGAGPWLTLLHGFPTCSWDWHAAVPRLAEEHATLAPDFLGFGDSDKPRGRPYSIDEQADIVEAVWAHYGVETTGIVAHDYGATVAQELLARHDEDDLPVDLRGCVFLNAGLYHDAHRPPGIQRLLRTPVVGAIAAQFVTQGVFRRSFTGVFSDAHPPDPDRLEGHWEGITRRGGKGVLHRLLRSLDEREEHADRWEGALEETGVPCRFVWGLADPVSGGAVVEAVRERVPDADLVELEDVGHYPHLEVPERVAAEVVEFYASLPASKGSSGS